MKFGFKHKNFFVTLICFMLILNANLFAQDNENFPEPVPQISNSIDSKSTLLRITTNVKSAAVYLNGHYQGDTPLVINNLPQGTYRLELKKEHYQTILQNVEVAKGISNTYNFELISMSGIISINSTPSNPMIFVDGNQIFTNQLQLAEGPHKIELRAFGYKTFVEWVNVKRDQDFTVEAELQEIPFNISSLSADKNCFNPGNLGEMGRVQINFSVTSPADGTLTITDVHGRRVFFKDYIFSNWDYSFIWNGRDNYGVPVEDGNYTVTVQSGEVKRSIAVTVDSTINPALMGVTKSGTGLGFVPSAQTLNAGNVVLDFSLGLTYNATDLKVEFFPFTFGFAYVPINGLELSGVYNIQAGWNGGINGNLTVKYAKDFVVSNNLHVQSGLLARVGASSVMQLAPYGTDTGTGSGLGIVFGVDTGLLYGGLSSEVVYGCASSPIFGGTDLLWKNGFLVQVRNQNLSVGMWAAINSTWGSYKWVSVDGTVQEGSINSTLPMGLKSLDNGIELIANIRQTSVRVNAKAGYICYFEQPLFYAYGNLGFSLAF